MVFIDQRQSIIPVSPLPKDEINLFGGAWKQVEMKLQHRAGFFTRGDASFQPQAV